MSYNKYYTYKKQVSYDGGTTWIDVFPNEFQPSGSSIGFYDTLEECEMSSFEGKYKFMLSDSLFVSKPCDSTSAITSAETSAYTSTLVNVEIGDCVTSIGAITFSGCTSLSSVTIGNGVTSIGCVAFRDCSGLTSIDIPSGVTIIDRQTFQNCISLTSVTIGSGVTEIGYEAFQSCSGLNSITIKATTPPELYRVNAFSDTNECPIYVPAESVDTYKSASGWSTYADRIQAIS